jgi:hypothetical protein
VQVGWGSVGLMRTASSATAIGPVARHKAATRPKNILVMIASLFFLFLRGMHAWVIAASMAVQKSASLLPRVGHADF